MKLALLCVARVIKAEFERSKRLWVGGRGLYFYVMIGTCFLGFQIAYSMDKPFVKMRSSITLNREEIVAIPENKQHFVYVIASLETTDFYVGRTKNLQARIQAHLTRACSGSYKGNETLYRRIRSVRAHNFFIFPIAVIDLVDSNEE